MCDKSLEELNQLLDDLDAQIDQAYSDDNPDRAAEFEFEALFLEVHIEEQHAEVKP
jgi:hypothetical protein